MNFISLFVSVTLTFILFSPPGLLYSLSLAALYSMPTMGDAVSCCVSWCYAWWEQPPLFLLLYFMEAMTMEDGWAG